MDQAERGLIDADLGGGLIKQRVARPNEGRRGGYRMLVGYRQGHRAVFLFGFAKSDLDNVKEEQLAELRPTGQLIIIAGAATLEHDLKTGNLLEIDNDEESEGREC